MHGRTVSSHAAKPDAEYSSPTEPQLWNAMRPLVDRIRRHQAREKSRGQSLVEFALTLPVILLLTLIALDFGRVYLGYINLQNMARIASNFAANNPDAWGATPDTDEQAKYRNQILADATATNCRAAAVRRQPGHPHPGVHGSHRRRRRPWASATR